MNEKPKDARIAVRVDHELKDRLTKISEETGLDEATIIRACIEAFLEYVERHGQITLPFEMEIHSKKLKSHQDSKPPKSKVA